MPPRLTAADQNELLAKALSELYDALPAEVGAFKKHIERWRVGAIDHATYYGTSGLNRHITGTGVTLEEVQAIAALIWDDDLARIT